MNKTLRNTLPLKKLEDAFAGISHSNYKRGKVSAMLHKGAGDGSNSQIILKWPRYYIFFNNSQAKKKLSK